MEETIIMQRNMFDTKEVTRMAKFLGAKAAVGGLKLMGGAARGFEIYYGLLAVGSGVICATAKSARTLTDEVSANINKYADSL